MNKNIVLYILLFTSISLSCSKNDNSKRNAAYFSESANNQSLVTTTLENNEAYVTINPRLANLESSSVNLHIAYDESVLTDYNLENNTIYKPIDPKDFSLKSSDGAVSVSESLSFIIKAGDISTPIELNVSHMDPDKYLSSEKYAIPLRLQSASDVDVLESANSMIILINRSLITSVLRIDEPGYIEIAPYKEFNPDDEWTMQFMALYPNLNNGNQTTCYFGELYTRINKGGLQVKNGRDGDDTWTNKPLKENVWFQVSYVYKEKSISVYVDGELQRTFMTSKLAPSPEQKIYFTDGSYKGVYLREFRFFSKALLDSEIKESLYQKLSIETSGLEIYLPMDKESGFNDVTLNENIVFTPENMKVEWIDNVKFPSETLEIVE